MQNPSVMRTAHLPQSAPVGRRPSAHARHTAANAARAKGFGKASAVTSQDGDDIDQGKKTKLAVAAKISAARSLARKLAEEKQAAAAASQLASQRAVDPETAAELIRSAEAEVAELAKEAAEADAVARASRRGGAAGPQLQELQRLKEENKALQELVMQLAADRKEAEKRLAEVKQQRGAGGSIAAASAAANGTGAAAAGGPTKAAAMPQLVALAEKANGQGLRVMTSPEAPVSVGSTVRVLYNLAAGPLPTDSGKPTLKLGLNRWETQTKVAMEKVGELDSQGSWWSADVALPKLLFRLDFVVEDANSGAVDNNGGKDFSLDLGNAPTAEEVTAARLELLEAAEAAAEAAFAEEEDRIYAAWMAAAEGAAKEARLTFTAARRESLLKEARAVVEERRGAAAGNAAAAAKPEIEGVFTWSAAPEPGTSALLLYNKASGPLADAGSVVVHVGYDGWWMQDKRVLPMRPVTPAEAKKLKIVAKEGEEWWCAEVPVWNTAAVIDFAFTNDARSAWDNRGGADYHTPVKNAASGDKLVQLVFQALQAADVEDAARGEALAERRVLQRAATKANAGRKRRELQRKFLYTEPLTPRAGQRLKIYYNPDRTVLRGRPDVFMRAGFNRWRHGESMDPQRMTPAVPDAGGLGFLTAEIDVPADAYAVDLVFQDSEDMHGGFTDNNRGLDYHIPTMGGTTAAPAMRVAHIASEMAPIAKAGGLGDVVTALGRAVQEEGHEVEIVLPKYDCIDYSAVENLVLVKEFMTDGIQVKVWRGTVEGLTTTFLEPLNGLFWVGRIYVDMHTDRHRFGVFCACALRYLLHESPRRPDILHCHDWQSGPIASMDRQGVAAAFTIHNMNYGVDIIGGAMAAVDVATTVSPTYATEIGGHPAIAPHHAKFFGIRNGIDMDIWDPASDPMLPLNFTAEDAAQGKAAAKAELRRRMGLAEGDVPIVGCVTRLTHQKGIHLIKHAAWRAMERGAQFVLLGSAPDPKVQAEFDALAEDLKRQYPDRARLWFAYDEPLSHLIYAGSDMFLVPSMFEPCGLTQMIAMRYGTVAVVRRTGGLADTVFDVDDDAARAAAQGMEPNGFSFEGADSEGLDYALNRALAYWYGEKEVWAELVQRVMNTDWSWSSPAQDYIELYHRALKK